MTGVQVIMSSYAFESGETNLAATLTDGNGGFELAVVGESPLDFIPPNLEEEFVDITGCIFESVWRNRETCSLTRPASYVYKPAILRLPGWPGSRAGGEGR